MNDLFYLSHLLKSKVYRLLPLLLWINVQNASEVWISAENLRLFEELQKLAAGLLTFIKHLINQVGEFFFWLLAVTQVHILSVSDEMSCVSVLKNERICHQAVYHLHFVLKDQFHRRSL